MVGNLFGRQKDGDDGGNPQSEAINWLPRSRLRSGGRRDVLLTSLMVATVSLLAAVAGFAAWSRHSDDTAATSSAAQKPTERVSVARAPAVPAAPIAPAAAPSAPVRNVVAAPIAPAPPSESRAPLQSSPAATSAVISTDTTGAPIGPASTPTPAARIQQPAETAQPVSPPQPVAPAPLTNFSAGSFEVLPPLAGVADWAPPPVAPATAPSPPVRSDATAPRDLASAARPASAPPAVPPAAAPQRTAALSQPVPPGAKVSVYLDEYPDQKAAAAALSQKSGAYGKAIGSAGKLTYTRRNADSWRLRVSNLDQSAAEAMCVRLRSAGAPCTVGPN